VPRFCSGFLKTRAACNPWAHMASVLAFDGRCRWSNAY
jgi:hypothetical protein